VPDCPERVHWDEAFALEVGAPGAYDYGPERCSWLTHHLTNWMGDDGFLRKSKCQVRRHNPDGDVLFIDGVVSRKFVEDGKHLVEIRQNARDASRRIVSANGSAIVELPAQLIILATNTMHKLAGPMMVGVNVPFVHIADATAKAINERGLRRPGLMATAFTMEQSFYTERLIAAGLSPVLPNVGDRAETHRIIYEELCKDITTDESAAAYIAIANRLIVSGADSLILGCTEVGMLLNQGNVALPVFDTTLIHCAAALDWALQ
jgi:aspartate racemase